VVLKDWISFGYCLVLNDLHSSCIYHTAFNVPVFSALFRSQLLLLN